MALATSSQISSFQVPTVKLRAFLSHGKYKDKALGLPPWHSQQVLKSAVSKCPR